MSITQFQLEEMQRRLAKANSQPVLPPQPITEKKIHQQIMDHCDAQWPKWKYIHSRMDRPTCNEAGVPDFIILLPRGQFLMVEAKRPGEKISTAQRDWHFMAGQLEHEVKVVYSVEEFIAVAQLVGHSMSNPPP